MEYKTRFIFKKRDKEFSIVIEFLEHQIIVENKNEIKVKY